MKSIINLNLTNFIFTKLYGTWNDDDYLDAKYRIKMIQLAIEELGFGEICQIELERKGQSYTYETLKISLIMKKMRISISLLEQISTNN